MLCHDYGGWLGMEARLRFTVQIDPADKAAWELGIRQHAAASALPQLWVHQIVTHQAFFLDTRNICEAMPSRADELWRIDMTSGATVQEDEHASGLQKYGMPCPKPCELIGYVQGVLSVVGVSIKENPKSHFVGFDYICNSGIQQAVTWNDAEREIGYTWNYLPGCTPTERKEFDDSSYHPQIDLRDANGVPYSGKYGKTRYEYAYWIPHCGDADVGQPMFRRLSTINQGNILALPPEWRKIRGIEIIPFPPDLGPRGRQRSWIGSDEPESWDGPISLIGTPADPTSFVAALAALSRSRQPGQWLSQAVAHDEIGRSVRSQRDGSAPAWSG